MEKSEFSIISVPPKSQILQSRKFKHYSSEKEKIEGLEIQSVGIPRKGLLTPPASNSSIQEIEKNWKSLLENLRKTTKNRAFINLQEPLAANSELYYKFIKSDVKIVRTVLENAGFVCTTGHDWSILWSCGAPNSFFYQNLNTSQRVNHFPSSTEITRKDKLCTSITQMQEKFGKKYFDITPDTYNLPDEFADFYAHFHNEKHLKWIVKPPASSQGKGIYLVDSINEVPIDDTCIISKYIENPLLINNLKFDMRIYVLVTSYEPLRIYIYEEGLVRFACEPYNPQTKKNKYSHLTNYSLNKHNENFVQNQDYRCDNVGHKWSISALCKHLEADGVDIELMWARIYDLIIKTIISSESSVTIACKKHGLHHNNCFDLFGFDVILDSNLKPWLLEVNLSPSLSTDSPLDYHIKSNLLIDSFNLMGIEPLDKKKDAMAYTKNRISFRSGKNDPSPSRKKFNYIQSPKFQEHLRDTLEQYERRGHFIRIYPAKGTDYYDNFFQPPKMVNKAMYKVLFNDATGKKTPTIENLPAITESKSPNRRFTQKSRQYSDEKAPRPEKIVLTADDILIEYISRIWHAVRSLKEEKLKSNWRRNLERFITHSVWHGSDTRRGSNSKLWKRLENRLIEMKERRRRLITTLQGDEMEKYRKRVLRQFSGSELESMLKSSFRTTAVEVVGCLFDVDGKGILTEMIRWLATITDKDSVLASRAEIDSQDIIYFDEESYEEEKF
jgi:tubulin polyglutamylase TTLL5